jgi:uncharacterized protein (TIGR03000 family)
MTLHRFRLGSLIVIGVFLPGPGFAQSGLPIIPQVPGVAQTLPIPLLPGTLVPQSASSNQLPVPVPLQATAANQLPIPIPLQTTAAGQPAVSELPEAKPEATRTPAPIKEPDARFRRPEGEPGFPEAAFGTGHWCWSGWRYGPRVAPKSEYPGLGGGPQVIYPWGMPGYTGRNGECSLDKPCRLWGPPVPVYSPVPEPNTTKDLIYPGRNISSPGFIYGWVGPFPASPRYKHYAVNSWAQPGTDLSTGGPNSGKKNAGGVNDTKKPGGYLTLSVKVPHPGAEVFVDGVKTTQTGTDRIFSSPELEEGKEFRYEVTVRWIDHGATYEQKKIVIGSSGEKIPLDFTAPEVVRAER